MAFLCCQIPLHAQEEPEWSTHREFLIREGNSGPEKPGAAGSVGVPFVPPGRTERETALTREVFGYFPYWFSSRWQQLDYSLVSTIAYFCAEVASDGSITSTHGWPRYAGDPSASASVLSMITAAHAQGVRVVLCFTNFDAPSLSALLSTPAYRETFITAAGTLVQAGNADGVNINFEGIPSASRDHLTAFMRALADTLHTRFPGSQVSCAPTDFDTRPGDWDLPAIYPYVDLFFFQGYGYHYSGSNVTGPIGLLPNGSFWGSTNITTLIGTVLSRIPADKVLLGLPHFGYRWAAVGPDPKAATKGNGVAIYYPDALTTSSTVGRQWDVPGLTPWYRYYADTSWFQGWYEDPESMGHKYAFAIAQNLRGIGMWALGMDASNHDIWDVLAAYFSDSTFVSPPARPTLSFVRAGPDAGSGEATVGWRSGQEPHLGGFRLFVATDPSFAGATPRLDENDLGSGDTSVVLTGLSSDSLYYVRMIAIDTSGTKASDTSDTYAVRPGSGTRYLVVDGFDRVTGSWNFGRHPFAARVGGDIALAGRRVDVCDNDAVISGDVGLEGYAGLLWLLGDESTADRTFGPGEKAHLAGFLDGGGKLFVSGSEIGWDLGRIASPNSDTSFYRRYLKAAYLGDAASSTSFSGLAGSLFEGISGTCGIEYPEEYPDYVQPSGGSAAVLSYTGGQVAGIGYRGAFGEGTNPGALVYLCFPIETIGSNSVRATLVSRVLDYFEGTSSVGPRAGLPSGIALLTSYPNPFNPRTRIAVTLPEREEVELRLFDMLGREVAVLFAGRADAGVTELEFDGSTIASGTYFARLMRKDGTALTHRLVHLK